MAWFSELLKRVFASHHLEDYLCPWEWALESISFRRCKSAEHDRLVPSVAPYLVDPVDYWEFAGKRREMTVVAPQQTGKTLTWLLGLLWTFIYKPCLSLIIYESVPKAQLMNAERFKPMMEEIPKLKAELDLPRTQKVDCFNFSWLSSYFMGAGVPTTSISAKICVCDELDKWQEHEGKIANIEEVRLRMRSFSEALLVKVCSVDGDAEGSRIWREFMASSRGYWHLRCESCGALTMRSCDVHNLQWECDADGNPIESSIRLVCPICKHEHLESAKEALNVAGGYIHEIPGLFDANAGFQWGCLAAWNVDDFRWVNIAKAQMAAGRSGDYQDQLKFDNTYRGLPYIRRKSNEKELNVVKKHCAALPSQDKIKFALFSADTQNDCFYWVVRGWTPKADSYLLGNGRAENLDALKVALDKAYCGHIPSLAIIDQGGPRAKEVQAFAWREPGVYSYKGFTTKSSLTRYEISDSDPRQISANPKTYQGELLYRIYERSNAFAKQFFLPPDPDKEYLEHIMALRPDNKSKFGHSYPNYTNSGAPDHYFDCEKMVFVLFDHYIKTLLAQQTQETRKCKAQKEE